MSNLLQFQGKVDKKGVHLEAYQIKEEPWYKEGNEVEMVPCTKCHRKHPRLWIFIRKPAGMLGGWIVFRYNGEEHVPDLSVPIALVKMPKDAKPVMSDDENSIRWHTTS